jgi:hypothetical protein
MALGSTGVVLEGEKGGVVGVEEEEGRLVSMVVEGFVSGSRPDCEGGGEGGFVGCAVGCVAGIVAGAVVSAVFVSEASMLCVRSCGRQKATR